MLILLESALVVRESPQEKRRRCQWLSTILCGGNVSGNVRGMLCMCHTFCYKCTCVDVQVCIAVWCYAFCYPFSKWDQNFNITVYSINHFMLQHDSIFESKKNIENLPVSPDCCDWWCSKLRGQVVDSGVNVDLGRIYVFYWALLWVFPKRLVLIRYNNVEWKLKVKPDPFLFFGHSFYWSMLVSWLKICSSG